MDSELKPPSLWSVSSDWPEEHRLQRRWSSDQSWPSIHPRTNSIQQEDAFLVKKTFLSSPSPVQNPSPKSNIQSQEEREWDWGWQYNLTGHQHHPTHPPITLLTRNVNLVMGKDLPWPSLTFLDLPSWPSMTSHSNFPYNRKYSDLGL